MKENPHLDANFLRRCNLSVDESIPFQYKFGTMIRMDSRNDDYDLALISLKKLSNVPILSKKATKEEQEVRTKLSEAFIGSKIKRIHEIFINKLRRGYISRRPPKDLKEKWEKQEVVTGLQGYVYHQKIWYTAVLLHIIGILLLLLMSTFCGFIDVFTEVNSAYAGVYVTKALSLFFIVIYFIIACTRKSFYGGKDRVYIHQILHAYLSSGGLVLDFIVIVLTVLSIALPTVQGIMIALFFIIIFSLGNSRADLIQIQMAFFKSQNKRLLWNLIKVLLFNIIFAHCLATILLGVSEYDHTNNWITYYYGSLDEVAKLNWFQIYVSAFYWATTIMMTVGFGDFLPLTTEQLITVAFIEIFSCIVLAYNISEIGNIISTLREKNESFMKKMAIFQRILIHHQKTQSPLDKYLEKRIYNFLSEEQSGSSNLLLLHEQEELIESLPENLKMSYLQEAYKPVYRELIFLRHLKPSTLSELSVLIKSEYYYPGKYFGAYCQEDILILQRGQVSLTYRKFGSTINGTPIDYISADNPQYAKKGKLQRYIDEQGEVKYKQPLKRIPKMLSTNFLSLEKAITFDMMAEKQCHIWKIEIADFWDALSKSEIDKSFYFSVLHKSRYLDHQKGLIDCPRCSDLRHTSFECPKIHYMPLKSEVIDKYRRLPGNNQQRKVFTRSQRHRRKNTHIALLEKKQLVEISEDFYRFDANRLDQFEEQQYIVDKGERQDAAQKTSLYQEKINEQKLQALMYGAVRRYDLNYKDEYWSMETDAAQNYSFYFPLSNANRLVLVPLNENLNYIPQTKTNIEDVSSPFPPPKKIVHRTSLDNLK